MSRFFHFDGDVLAGALDADAMAYQARGSAQLMGQTDHNDGRQHPSFDLKQCM